MVPEFAAIDPSALRAGPRYDLLTASIQPRPIALVSTCSASGTPNLAPFSFFTAGGSNPPSVVVSVALGSGGVRKDSLTNIEATGEYVVNLVDRSMAQGMNAVSFGYPSEFDEWSISDFHPLASDLVAPPRVAESPVQFECRLHEIVRHGEGPGSANYLVGEVLRAHVRRDLWTGERFAEAAFRPIARMGGSEYLDTAKLEIFLLPRPTDPSDPSVSE